MRLPWHRDRLRRCVHCGEEWRVPYQLAKRYRPSKWRVGIAPGDQIAMGALFTAAIEDQLDMAHQRADLAARRMTVTDDFRHCPKCGAGAYTQRKLSRASRPAPG